MLAQTVDADFSVVRHAAAASGVARATGPVPQGAWLLAMGIAQRWEQLAAQSEGMCRLHDIGGTGGAAREARSTRTRTWLPALCSQMKSFCATLAWLWSA